MTNEEAIEILKGYRNRLTSSCSNQLWDDIEAFDLAIKALEEHPTGKWNIRRTTVTKYYWECPYCEATYPQDRDHQFAPKHCAWCGIKMEEAEDE